MRRWQVAPRRCWRARGGLAAGASLDLVTLHAHDPALAAHSGDELLDSWIFSAGRSAIDCVWRAGLKLVSNGVHHERDAIRARYAAGAAAAAQLRGSQGGRVMLKKIVGLMLAAIGAFAVAGIALHRHEPINALWIVTAAVCVYLLGLSLLRRLDRHPGASRSIRRAPPRRNG